MFVEYHNGALSMVDRRLADCHFDHLASNSGTRKFKGKKLSFQLLSTTELKIRRTIVLQAWVSSDVTPILKMGFFPNALS